ncbi:unnamed protein product [Leuciscus chuanchicus]
MHYVPKASQALVAAAALSLAAVPVLSPGQPDAEMMSIIIIALLVNLLIETSVSFTVVVPRDQTVAHVGSTVTLPCWISPPENAEALEIRWYRHDQFSKPVLLYQHGKIQDVQEESFRNRSSLTLWSDQSGGLKDGDVSLRLEKLRIQDEGSFHCYVSGESEYDTGEVVLKVTDPPDSSDSSDLWKALFFTLLICALLGLVGLILYKYRQKLTGKKPEEQTGGEINIEELRKHADGPNGFFTNSDPPVTLSLTPRPEQLGVLLDCDHGQLSFYNVKERKHLLTMSSRFTGSVVPLFNPGVGDPSPLEILDCPKPVESAVESSEPLLRMLTIIVAVLVNLFIETSVSFTVVVPHDQTVAHVGSTVTLPCWISPPENAEALEIRWYRHDQFSNPVLFYQHGKIQDVQEESYRDRSSLTLWSDKSGGLKDGDVSLRLEKLRIQDEGSFHCYVSGESEYDSGEVVLKVTALGSAPVLFPQPLDDGRVNISCKSSGWYPEPDVTWMSDERKVLRPGGVSRSRSRGADEMFSVYSWTVVSHSDAQLVSCSMSLKTGEFRESRIDIQAVISSDPPNSSDPWKALFFTLLICALLGLTGLILYKYRHKLTDVEDKITEELKKDTGGYTQKPQCIQRNTKSRGRCDGNHSVYDCRIHNLSKH